MVGWNGGGAILTCRVIRIRAKPGECRFLEILNARIAPFVDLAGTGKKRNANVVKFTIGEAWAQMAQAAPAFANEKFKATFGTVRVFGRSGGIACRKGVSELVKRRSFADQRFLICGKRFTKPP